MGIVRTISESKTDWRNSIATKHMRALDKKRAERKIKEYQLKQKKYDSGNALH